MSGMGTAIGDVIGALVDGLRVAGPEWSSPWDDTRSASSCPVYDGPEVMAAEDDDAVLLVVGWTGEDDTGLQVSSGQAVATIGTSQHREEMGSVLCVAVAQTGDSGAGVARIVRDQACAVVRDVDVWLRAHGSLGLVPGYRSVFARIGDIHSVRTFTTNAAGVVCELSFTINFSVRL
jgi:hypothetical protein